MPLGGTRKDENCSPSPARRGDAPGGAVIPSPRRGEGEGVP